MTPVVRHWKIHYGGFWHHFLDFRRHPKARLHWGYRCVVELVRHGPPNVRRTTWEAMIETVGGSPASKPVLVREAFHHLDEIFDRAHNEVRWPRYNLIFNNCEHFANSVMIGKRRSRQVNFRTLQSVSSLGMASLATAFAYRPEPPIEWAAWTVATYVFAALMAADFARFVVRSMIALRRLDRMRRAREEGSDNAPIHPVVA